MFLRPQTKPDIRPTPWRWIGRIGPAVFFMVMIFYFSAMPAGEVIQNGGQWMDLATRMVQRLTFGYPLEISWLKVGHFIGYFGLGLAYRHALTGWAARPGTWAILLAALYAVSDEVHQTFISGRHAELRDLAIDTGAAALAVAFASLREGLRKNKTGQ